MKQILVMMAAVVLVGCGEKPASSTPKSEPKIPAPSQAAEAEAQVIPTPSPDPVSPADEKLIVDPFVEKAVRESLEKPEGEITEADLAKVPYLNLSNTKITDAGLKEMAKFKNLKILDLSSTQITDAGLKELAKLQNLGILELYSTKITGVGVAELKKALPGSNINGP